MFGGLTFGGAPFAGVVAVTSVLTAAPSITVGTSAALSIPARLSASSSIAWSAQPTLNVPSPLGASAAVGVGASAALTTGVRFTASAGIRLITRFDFFPAMAGAASIRVAARATINPSPRAFAASITIAGIDVRSRVRVQGLQIRDILNDAPNTCQFVIEGDAPAVGQPIRITINEGGSVLFAGIVQAVTESFAVRTDNAVWTVNGIDDTGRINARRPFGTFQDVSATTIAKSITAEYGGGFVAVIEPGLPNISIVFDGTSTFISCLTQIANAVGGYCKVEDGHVYLFTTDIGIDLDPIDDDHKFLFNPPIQINTDASQIRTRVFGKGYGETVQADLAATETLIPIQDGATFTPLGGAAILGLTPDAAASERIAYTGVVRDVGGTLVGPGASPTVAPIVALAAGSGVTSGAHDVAVVFVTALGKSKPSPVSRITVGTVAPPATAPTAGTPISGTGVDAGTHEYAASFLTAFGETIPGGGSASVTVAPPDVVSPGGVPAGTGGYSTTGGSMATITHYYKGTYITAAGETTPGAWLLQADMQPGHNANNIPLQISGDPRVTGRRIYRSLSSDPAAVNWNLVTTIGNNTASSYFDGASDGSIGGNPHPPPTNTSGVAFQRVPVTNIPIGPLGTTARNLYRRVNGSGAFRLVTTIGNNTATTYTDATPNSALGASALSTPTAVANQIAITLPIGPSAVTGREVYMSLVGGGALKYAGLTAADNTTTAGTITASDAALAAAPAAPIADTSGLTQPPGQVNPGETTLPVAAAAVFRTGGGWVRLGGGQTVRYTGISGQMLTGIPTSGAGAITTTVLYGQQATNAPMLIGVTGLTRPVLKGSSVNIWVQRDDVSAQTEHAARTGGDGIVEYTLTDMRRAEPSLTDRVLADLQLFSRPIVTASYATRDIQTRSGKRVPIRLRTPPVDTTLVIQDVTITEIDIAPNLWPKFTVQASSVRFSLEDTLRQLIAVQQQV